MKKLNKLFFLFATVLATVGFSACTDDNEGPRLDIETPVVEAGAKSDNPSVMDVNLYLEGVKQIAYEVVEGHNATRGTVEENSQGALIFKNARETGEGIIDAVEGKNVVTVKGLEGNKDYTVRFAFWMGENTYEVEDVNITTPGYNKILTILDVTTDGFRVHVELPDTMYWRWGYMESSLYAEMEGFGATDMDRLEYNGGVYEKGSKTIEVKNGEVWYYVEDYVYDEETWEVIGTEKMPEYHAIYPGYSYVFMLAECDQDGVLHYDVDWGDDWGDDWGMLGSELPNIQEETEVWSHENITFEGKYARAKFDIAAPALIESKLTVEQVLKTARRAKYNIIPSEETYQYAVTIFTKEQYEMLLGWVGPNALKWVALNYAAAMGADEPMEIEVGPLDPETSYMMLVYGSYSDDSMIMSYEEYEVNYEASTKEPVVLDVKAATSEEMKALGYDPAYMVGFKVTCPAGNCAGVRYVMNYTSEWDYMAEYYTPEQLLEVYGNDVMADADAECVNGINSSEGYIMAFATTEATASTMAIAGYNVDEAMGEIIVAEATSAVEMGTPFESELFDVLQGDWTAQYTYQNMNGETLSNPFKVSIGLGVDANPVLETADEQAMIQYFMEANGYTEEEAKQYVADNYADYKAKAEVFNAKHRSLNRMIINGFEPLHEYKSAWDLAIDLTYSAADTEDLFYDYGPKMFLQLYEDGTASLNASIDKFPPMSGWYTFPGEYSAKDHFLTGFAVGAESFAPIADFPVEISEDKQTITVKSMNVEGTEYYPSVAYPSYGTSYGWMYGGSFRATGTTGIVLTKGWNGDEPAEATRATKTSVKKLPVHRQGHRFMKTNLPNSKKAIIAPKTVTIDPAAAGVKLMKDMKRRERMIEALKK